MEDTLRGGAKLSLVAQVATVLILVLMEDTLRAHTVVYNRPQ